LPRLTLMEIDTTTLTSRALKSPAVARSIGIVSHASRSLSPAALLLQREIKAQTRRHAAAGS
jgi:hypothetical protein